MPVLICRDMHNGNEGYCLPFEGRSGLGVWGVYNDDVEATLQVIEKQFAPAVNQVLTEQGGIPVKGIIARSLQMNDDIHTRQTAAGLILLSEIAPKLMHSDLDREAITMCIEMFSSSERWFHPLGMASAMSTIRGLKGTEYSTVVTAICNGGVNTGLKVAALGEQWFTAPAPMLTGSYLSPQWSEKDASPLLRRQHYHGSGWYGRFCRCRSSQCSAAARRHISGWYQSVHGYAHTDRWLELQLSHPTA